MTSSEPSILRRVGGALVRLMTWPFRRWRVIALIFIALAIVYTIADQILLRRLAAQREQIRAAGGAVEYSDLHLPKLDPEENAAIPYRHAAALVGRMYKSRNDGDLMERLRKQSACPCGGALEEKTEDAPLIAEDWRAIGEHMAATQAALDMVKEGCALKGCQFSNFDSPEALVANPGAVLPDLAFVRMLAREVSYRALWESHNGNTDDAIKWVTLGLHLSNGLESDPYMIAGLVRIACAGLAFETLEAVLCEHDISPNTLEALLHEAQRSADRRLTALTFQGERCFSGASYTNMSLHMGTPIRPFMTLNQMKGNEMFGWLIDASQQTDFVRRAKAYKHIEVETARMSKFYGLVKILAPALLRANEAGERNIAQAVLAQAAIALKRYKKDQGAYPDGLSALAPKYVQEEPVDNFSGKPFLYKREGEGFLLYSVGIDGQDDGGKQANRRDGDIVWCAKN